MKIKTAMLKRLRKEYESYEKETNTISAKMLKLEEELSLNKDEEIELKIRKNVRLE